ncbi:MAG: nucleotidyltransferase family protein, partial [Gemmobacter sp.]|nr:nucleotidyltransferase family protein [Gemmobacter sp.]
MRNRFDAVMLFSAGFGTRMGALTATRPKPLVPVAGRALIDHALDLIADAGIARTVVNLHYLGDQIAAHLAGRPDTALSWEQDVILDTGAGLRAALPMLGDGPVYTLNPDAIWTGTNPLRTLEREWRPDMGALLMLGHVDQVRGRVGKGDFSLDAQGRITRGGDYLYLGAQIIDPS